MDAAVVSKDLRDLIDVLQGNREVENTNESKDDANQLDSPTTMSKHIVQLIVPQINIQPNEMESTFSFPPLDLTNSPRLDSPISFSPVTNFDSCENGCLNEVSNILDEMHPLLFEKSTKKENNSPSTQVLISLF